MLIKCYFFNQIIVTTKAKSDEISIEFEQTFYLHSVDFYNKNTCLLFIYCSYAQNCVEGSNYF